MMPLTLFLVSFALGPAIFWVLARQRPSRSYFAALWIASALLAGAALLLPLVAGQSTTSAVAVVVLLWLGWIMVIALCFLAAQARLADRRTRRFVFATCAMGTTLPWFGLYTAQMIGR